MLGSPTLPTSGREPFASGSPAAPGRVTVCLPSLARSRPGRKAGPVSAIGCLLARADEVRRFFDEVLDSLPDAPTNGFAAEAARDLQRYADPRRFSADNADLVNDLVEPPYRSLITPDRWHLLGRWGSTDALFIAAHRGVTEKLNGRWDVCTLEHYVSILEERERLLDTQSLQVLLDDAVKESLAWGPLAPDVTQRVESLADALRLLSAPDMKTRERWRDERDSRIHPAWRTLRQYAHPPPDALHQPTAATSTVNEANTEQDTLQEWARQLVVKWPAYRDAYDGPGRPLVAAFLKAELSRAPTAYETKAFNTAKDTVRQRDNRSA